jgi:hypothetical protein
MSDISACAHWLIPLLPFVIIDKTNTRMILHVPLHILKTNTPLFSSSESADRGRSIIQVTDNREYIKIQEWLMSYVQRNI